MTERRDPGLQSLDLREPIWERFFTVSPLVVVGTREVDGSYDLAPKHLAMPLGWDNYYGFVCTPEHATYGNILRERAFTVSFPRATEVVQAGQAATMRSKSGVKHALKGLQTFPAKEIDGVLLADASLYLECRLEKIIDGFGINSLIAGKIVAAHVRPDALRDPELDDQELIAKSPLLTYLYPGRFASVERSFSFPFPTEFKR